MADTQLVLMQTWEAKRHLFTEEEKAILNAAYAGETLCPRGIVTMITEQTKPLLDRLKA